MGIFFRLLRLLATVLMQGCGLVERNEGEMQLMTAIAVGDESRVRELLRKQLDINEECHFNAVLLAPLHLACYIGNASAVEALAEAHADVDLELTRNSCSPLHIASLQGHHQVVESLIKANADINLQRNTGSSPLYIASQEGHHEVVESLIKAKADVNLQDMDGFSPLYIASHNGHHQVVESLIKAKADVNLQQKDGGSPLYIASQIGHHQVVESLIKAKADVNLPEKDDGCSPLYIASQEGHHQVVESLIKAQADVNRQRNTGESPLYIASQNGHHQVVESLINANAAKKFPSAELEAIYWMYIVKKQQSPVGQTQAPSDSELSPQLHSALNKAGFVDSRAAMQSALADVLQQIQRSRLGYDKVFVVGSYSDGWGHSLKTLDGRADDESDIDVMQLIPGRLYHIRGNCGCSGAETVELFNGHVLVSGFGEDLGRESNSVRI